MKKNLLLVFVLLLGISSLNAEMSQEQIRVVVEESSKNAEVNKYKSGYFFLSSFVLADTCAWLLLKYGNQSKVGSLPWFGIYGSAFLAVYSSYKSWYACIDRKANKVIERTFSKLLEENKVK